MTKSSTPLQEVVVRSRDGQTGTATTDRSSTGEERLVMQLANGRRIVIPTNALVRQDDGSYFAPFDLATVEAEAPAKLSIPVIREELVVDKQAVITGGVRVRKTISEREEVIDEPLLKEEVTVERVPIDSVIGAAAIPVMRNEGDTLVIPILEEVLVVEKRLVLKEEVRITRSRQEVHRPERVVLRTEHAEVERFEQDE